MNIQVRPTPAMAIYQPAIRPYVIIEVAQRAEPTKPTATARKVQAGNAGGIANAVQQFSHDDGMATGVGGQLTPAQPGHGKIGKGEDTDGCAASARGYAMTRCGWGVSAASAITASSTAPASTISETTPRGSSQLPRSSLGSTPGIPPVRVTQ